MKRIITGFLALVTALTVLSCSFCPAQAKTKKIPLKDSYATGTLSASRDLEDGKAVKVVFGFRPKAVTGASIELQDPSKAYALFEVRGKNDYKKIATLRYYDGGLKVKGLYTYRAVVKIRKPWKHGKKYKYVVRRNNRQISNVVTLISIKGQDEDDTDPEKDADGGPIHKFRRAFVTSL
ncbi:MAG: hypothetical protein ACI4CS_00090 [Candidatus Weimeria sp.]